MASYSIVVKPSVEKDLRPLSKATIARILERVERLKGEPMPRQSMRLEGAEHMYRLRVGDYRVIYEIDNDSRRIVVHYIRHRRDVYRKL